MRANIRDLLSVLKDFSVALLTPADSSDPMERNDELVERIVPLLDKLINGYFRQQVEGIENVPQGPALIVGNHNSGITYLEIFGMGSRYYSVRGTDDVIHGLAHDQMFKIPLVGTFLSRCGGVRASQENAEKILRMGRKILVTPGGNMEAFRPYSERYKIKFGGHKGFVRLAMRTGAPISPVVLEGGHRSFVVVNDGAKLVKALGLHKRLRMDTFPLLLGLPWGIWFGPMFHLPLPIKCTSRFLEPVATEGLDPNDQAEVDRIYDLVTSRMQEAMDQIVSERR
jgi:diacylglycerol/phytol O-acyltransferase